MSNAKKIRICFVALNSYNLIANKEQIRHIGGAEVQQWLAARWLQSRGFQICFITLDHGQRDGTPQQGISIYNAYARDSGIPVLRFIWPRWSGLWSAMRRADCDVYYQRGGGVETGQVALWCRHNRRKFVHAIASELDCVPSLPSLGHLREKALYRYGLNNADAVIAQTEIQQHLLQRHFSKDSYLVRNCAPPLADSTVEQTSEIRREKKTVLWIGRFSPEKRFEWLLELAAQMPENDFIAIGASNKSSAYAIYLQNTAKHLNNVTLVGEVPYSRMQEYYQRASVLCSTSTKEGFPNVFLEAWRAGVPVVSTVDPDGVVKKHQLGYVANSTNELREGIQRVVASDEEHMKLSNRCREFFHANHTPEKTLPALEKLLLSL